MSLRRSLPFSALALAASIALPATHAHDLDAHPWRLEVMLYEPGAVIDARTVDLDAQGNGHYRQTIRVRDPQRLASLSASPTLTRLFPLPGTHVTRVDVRFRLEDLPERFLRRLHWTLERTGTYKTATGSEAVPRGARWPSEGAAWLLPLEVTEIQVPGSHAAVRATLTPNPNVAPASPRS